MDATKRVRDAVETAQAAGDTAQKRVERAVAKAAAETASEAKRPDKKTPARNTEEFIQKYYKKRFTPATAGKAYLLNFLFDVYQNNSMRINTTLWNMELLREKVHAEEDVRSFDSYYHLTEWLRSLYEYSRSSRSALRSLISDYTNITTSILAGENVRRHIQGDQDTTLTLWLNTLTLEAYTPQNDGGILVQSLRENIGEGIRFVKAYHAFLDVIAEYTGIPECAFLKIKTAPIEEGLSALNEALECLRDNVARYREPEIREASASAPTPTGGKQAEEISEIVNDTEWTFPRLSLTRWTPAYLEATMRNFQPIGEEPPVPEERLQFLRDSIRRDFKREFINWYVLYARYSLKYRIPVPAVTPPPGPKITMSIEAVRPETEEGK